FASKALRQQVSDEPILARPGDILDRRGRLLATTISAPSLYVDPSRIDDPDALSRKLAAALHLDAESLRRRFEESRSRRFLWVKRRLTDEEAIAVRQLSLPSSVAGLKQEFQRHYPQGEL